MTASRPNVGSAQGEPLLEREHEVGAFAGLLEGEGSGLVVVEGPAGIGKSRLIAELRERAAAEGRRVLSAFGSELEREFPFGVVRQLYEPLLVDAEERERLLADSAGAARPVFETLPAAGEGDVSFAALHGLYWLTVNLADPQPLLIVVDDLHWCDRPSLRFLVYLARRLEGLPALVVVGLRTAEPGTDPVLIGEVAAAGAALRLEPRSLSEAGVAELIRSRLGADPDPAFTDASLGATGGNPLLLRQLLSSLAADGVAPTSAEAPAVREVGPRAVSRTVLMRLHQLPAEATAVARATAILGDGAELPILAQLAQLDERAVADATADLVRTEILRPGPELAFVHPLVRDAVYHELPPGDRALGHSQAARLLADAGAAAEAVATHLLVAPRRGEEWAVDVLSEAAASARRRGAADSVVSYLQRALEEPPAESRRTQLLLELGLAETLTSGPDASERLRAAWRSLDDPREQANVAATLARTLLFTAPGQEAMDVAAQALAALPAELTDERQALRALELIAVFFGAGDQRALTSREGEQIEGDGPGARMLAAITSFGRALSGGSAEECVPLAQWALADGVLIAADPGLFPVTAIWVLVMADRDEALVAWEELRALAHGRGSMLGVVTVNLWRGATLLWRGDLREAEESLEGAKEGFFDWGLARSAETYVPAFHGMALLARGDLDGARAMLDPSRVAGDETDGYKLLLRGWAALLLTEGRHEEALAVADDLAGRFAFIANSYWAPWRSLKARALDGLGRTEEAIELAREELELAKVFGSPSLVGRALRELGTLERERGIERLRGAVGTLERSTAKLELAEAELALGAALRRQRKPTEARQPLQRALELASVCGAERLAEEARSELHASGVRPRRDALKGVESLTPSERRVVDIAVGGRTNRQIAQELYVTPKTVEVHLSNAYRKLGISSRRELGHALVA
ncbi:MAG TPA: AAA family ATPase [Solirubrobacterales bacterium]|nr:AAA family ATPase [Solirubrobacterales bacterium]